MQRFCNSVHHSTLVKKPIVALFVILLLVLSYEKDVGHGLGLKSYLVHRTSYIFFLIFVANFPLSK